MNLIRNLLFAVSVFVFGMMAWAAESSSAAQSSNIPEHVREASRLQMDEVWQEIQTLKQNDEEISEELYNRYFSLERILFPERIREERERPGGLDQGLDRCPGLTINQNGAMNWVDYGQTYWTVNDCARPRCRDGKDVIYQLNVTVEDFLTISTCGSNFDTWLCIYQNTCCTSTPFISNDDNDEVCGYLTMRAAVQACFTPGTYYIVLDGFSRAAYGHYQLSITSPGTCEPPDPEFECPTSFLRHVEDDIDDEACGVGNMQVFCGDIICGEVFGSGDIDAFFFDVDECSQWTLNIWGNDTPGHEAFGFGLNPYGTLFNSDCEGVIATNNDVSEINQDSRVVTDCLRPDRYWFEIGGQVNTTGPYIFQINCSLCEIPPQFGDVTVTFPDGIVCASWGQRPPGTTYYVWRSIADGNEVWDLVSTQPFNDTNYCEAQDPEFDTIFAVFSSACAVPSGGPSVRHDNRTR